MNKAFESYRLTDRHDRNNKYHAASRLVKKLSALLTKPEPQNWLHLHNIIMKLMYIGEDTRFESRVALQGRADENIASRVSAR